MKRIILFMLSFAFVAITIDAQKVEFNHQTGKYLEIDGANIYYEEIKNA